MEIYQYFISLYVEGNIEKIIELINEYYNNGIDLTLLLNDIIEYETSKMIDQKAFDTNKCSLIKELDNILSMMKKSENPKIIFEVSIINLINNANKTIEKKVEIAKSDKDNDEPKKEQLDVNNANTDIMKKNRISNTLCKPQKDIISNIRNSWNDIKNLAFDQKYGNISRILSSDTIPVAASETNIIIISKMNGLAEQINNDIIMVEDIFFKTFNKSFKVICISEKEWMDCIEKYKKDKNQFKYIDEEVNIPKKKLSLMEKAKELFDEE